MLNYTPSRKPEDDLLKRLLQNNQEQMYTPAPQPVVKPTQAAPAKKRGIYNLGDLYDSFNKVPEVPVEQSEVMPEKASIGYKAPNRSMPPQPDVMKSIMDLQFPGKMSKEPIGNPIEHFINEPVNAAMDTSKVYPKKPEVDYADYFINQPVDAAMDTSKVYPKKPEIDYTDYFINQPINAIMPEEDAAEQVPVEEQQAQPIEQVANTPQVNQTRTSAPAQEQPQEDNLVKDLLTKNMDGTPKQQVVKPFEPVETTSKNTSTALGNKISGDEKDILGLSKETLGQLVAGLTPAALEILFGGGMDSPYMAQAYAGGKMGVDSLNKMNTTDRSLASKERMQTQKFENDLALANAKKDGTDANWRELKPVYDPVTKQYKRALLNTKSPTADSIVTDEIVGDNISDQNMASARAFKYRDKDGKDRWYSRDPNLNGKEVAYSDYIGLDKGTNEIIRARRQGPSGPITGPSGTLQSSQRGTMTAKGAETNAKVNEKIRGDKEFQAEARIYQEARKALARLETNSAIDRPFLMRKLAKMSGEVGVLTAADVQAFGGSEALAASIEQMLVSMRSGKYSESNRELYMELAREIIRSSSRDMQEIRRQYIESYAPIFERSGDVGVPETLMKKSEAQAKKNADVASGSEEARKLKIEETRKKIMAIRAKRNKGQ